VEPDRLGDRNWEYAPQVLSTDCLMPEVMGEGQRLVEIGLEQVSDVVEQARDNQRGGLPRILGCVGALQRMLELRDCLAAVLR
jgi:hypothetical protein